MNNNNPLKHNFKKIPLGIKIISGFYFFAGFMYLLTGIFSFIRGDLFQQIPGFAIGPGGIFTLFGIFMIALGIISFVSAYGLLKTKKWARIAVIIISSINIIGGIFSVIERDYISIVNLLLNLIIVSYLIFNKKVKSYFKLRNRLQINSLLSK